MKKLIHLIVIIMLVSTTGARGQHVSKDYFDGEVYIKIKKEIPLRFGTRRQVNIYDKLSFLGPLLQKYNIKKTESSFYFSKSESLQRIFRIYFRNSTMIGQLLSDLKRLKQIEYAEKVPIMRIEYTPNDLQDSTLNRQYYLHKVKAQQAWDIARGNPSVTVAIVDNAIDIFHRDLFPNFVSGWDVSDDDAMPTPPSSNAAEWFHGTHAAGIACARTDNGIDIASISYNCGLMAIKVTSDDSPGSTLDHAIEGVAWAAEHGAKVISCSWSGESSSTGQAVINVAHALNAVVVAAAGNGGENLNRFPASHNFVLSVASINQTEKKSSFSNFGTSVDVSAPGFNITSTIPDNKTTQMDGTSMACPLVAGLCGLVRSLNPGLSNDDVVNCVKNSTDNIDAQNPGFIGLLGTGRINAFKTVVCAFPCNGSIDLGPGVYTVLKTQSSGTITSANKIPLSTSVSFDAGVSVILQPGFTAVEGSVFHAFIDGCGGALEQTNPGNKPVAFRNEIVKEEIKAGESFLKVYPNPSRDKFNLSYQLSNDEYVNISIYNSNMKVVKQLLNRRQSPGSYIELFDAINLASGIYFANITIGVNVKTLKLIVMH